MNTDTLFWEQIINRTWVGAKKKDIQSRDIIKIFISISRYQACQAIDIYTLCFLDLEVHLYGGHSLWHTHF